MATVQDLQDKIDSIMVPGQAIVLDLAQLTFLDTSAIHCCIRAEAESGHPVVLMNASRAVRRILHLARLDSYPWVFDGHGPAPASDGHGQLRLRTETGQLRASDGHGPAPLRPSRTISTAPSAPATSAASRRHEPSPELLIDCEEDRISRPSSASRYKRSRTGPTRYQGTPAADARNIIRGEIRSQSFTNVAMKVVEVTCLSVSRTDPVKLLRLMSSIIG
jgi:hypothetical protein